jgi:hypothetical protein
MVGEKFIYTLKARRNIVFLLVLGLIILSLGILICLSNNNIHLIKRIWTNLWINNVYFVGVSIIGVFFVALQYVTKSGWFAGIKRIPEGRSSWLPIGFLGMLFVFLVANNYIFHWTHSYLYDPTHDLYDPIIVGKEPYLNYPFYIFRMFFYFFV